MVERADGQDRPGVAGARASASAPPSSCVREIVELVDRPHGDDVAQRHRHLRKGSAAEAVAVAFHDRHEAGA